jgi:murein L,D-transpeptidase YcbB/YkuD
MTPAQWRVARALIKLSQAVLAAALVSQLAIGQPALGWARAPTPVVDAPGSPTAGQIPALPAPPASSEAPGAPAGCATPMSQGDVALVSSPARQSKSKPTVGASASKRGGTGRAKQDLQGGSALSDDPSPTVTADTASCTLSAAQRYTDIAEHGGWPVLAKAMKKGASPDDLVRLRQRLASEGELPRMQGDAAERAPWDNALTEAVKHYQSRLGLRQTGIVDETTLKALDVPAADRANELLASAKRLAIALKLSFDKRHVVVNIPEAAVEAVEGGRVVHRYAAVIGGKDHQSPQIQAKITDIVVNPTWTLPSSIIKNEIIPKMAQNRRYLSRMSIKILDGKGREVNPSQIDWSSNEATEYTLRQDSGRKNSLGTLKINMPNKEAVYMHDTPAMAQFGQDYRFLSHGCVRVDGIYDLAVWLLDGTKGPDGGAWDVPAIKEVVKGEDKQTIKLKQTVPVVWVYLDGWASSDGTVHFRDDVYGLDQAQPAVPVSQTK